jgi:hypothetical protein
MPSVLTNLWTAMSGKKTASGAALMLLTLVIAFLSGAHDVLIQLGLALPLAGKIAGAAAILLKVVGLGDKLYKMLYGADAPSLGQKQLP